MYLGIHLNLSLGLCILSLVMSKFRCISLWEHEKCIYVPEIIFVQFNSHRSPPLFSNIGEDLIFFSHKNKAQHSCSTDACHKYMGIISANKFSNFWG